jgi:hypothetical protein
MRWDRYFCDTSNQKSSISDLMLGNLQANSHISIGKRSKFIFGTLLAVTSFSISVLPQITAGMPMGRKNECVAKRY